MNAEELVKRYADGERNFNGLKDDIDLSGANLRGVNLSETDLSCVDLSQANLSEANLSKCDLSDTDFTGANLSRANLIAADLQSAYFNGAILTAADLSQANLKYADLTGANLNQANLRNADLSLAHLESADLRSADLRGVNLEDAKYDNYTLFTEDFNPASYKGFWYNADTFIRCYQITSVEIAKSWDKFSDALMDMGYEDEIQEILESGYGDRYSFSDIPIGFSDLISMDWDSLKIEGIINTKLAFSRDIMYQLEDAIYDRELQLIFFLYT